MVVIWFWEVLKSDNAKVLCKVLCNDGRVENSVVYKDWKQHSSVEYDWVMGRNIAQRCAMLSI